MSATTIKARLDWLERAAGTDERAKYARQIWADMERLAAAPPEVFELLQDLAVRLYDDGIDDATTAAMRAEFERRFAEVP
jgi:hypothetical protein